jgi:hypothetical protein
MGAAQNDPGLTAHDLPGRDGREALAAAPTTASASRYPAGIEDLVAAHGGRWIIKGGLLDYRAQRLEGGVPGQLRVSHATAEGLDRALSALEDVQ